MSTYVPATEVAKLARTILKEHFAGTRFSVRTERSTGTLNIGWTDGPTVAAVRERVAILAGKCVDPTGDYTDYTDDRPVAAFTGRARALAEKLARGEAALSLLSGFVFVNRDFSPESWQLAGAEILAQRGVEVEYVRGQISGAYEPDAWLTEADGGRSWDCYSWNHAAHCWLAGLSL